MAANSLSLSQNSSIWGGIACFVLVQLSCFRKKRVYSLVSVGKKEIELQNP